MITKWQKILGLNDWEIISQRIDRDQVIFPDKILPKDRYFTGISIEDDGMKGTIYHDEDLTEEAVIHEMLHLRFPDKGEDWVNGLTFALVERFGSNDQLIEN